MYELTIRTISEGNEKVKIGSRTFAEKLANQYYDCIDVYCVELINAETGEIVFLRAKG
jgi:hypothetical protein